MQYIDVTERTLRDARPGIELVEELLQDSEFPIFLYGLTSKATVVLAAEVSLGGDGKGSGINLTEVAIALPFSKEAMAFLFGSGLTLSDQNFSYLAGGDGVRTGSFEAIANQPKVISTDFTRLALADSDAWLDEFLAQYGAAAKVTEAVVRAPVPAVKASRTKPTNSIDAFLSR